MIADTFNKLLNRSFIKMVITLNDIMSSSVYVYLIFSFSSCFIFIYFKLSLTIIELNIKEKKNARL